jgi:hypothetical protein
VALDEQLGREPAGRDDDEADEAAPEERCVIRRRVPVARHGRPSDARIRLDAFGTPAASNAACSCAALALFADAFSPRSLHEIWLRRAHAPTGRD